MLGPDAYLGGLLDAEDEVMAFRKFETGSGVSFYPWVRETESGLEVRCTTRDMPVGKWKIYVGQDDRTGFSFDVSYRHDDSQKKFTYSASMEDVKALFRKNVSRFSGLGSEEEVIAKLKEGVEVMFTDRLLEEHGPTVFFELT